MLSFKNYLKELAAGLPDFFTVGYALKEKRETEAKNEIKQKMFVEAIDKARKGRELVGFFQLPNVDSETLHRLSSVLYGGAYEKNRLLKKTEPFCKRYGIEPEEFIKTTLLELTPKYELFFKQELPELVKNRNNIVLW